jgi:hypothetical protein
LSKIAENRVITINNSNTNYNNSEEIGSFNYIYSTFIHIKEV